MNPNRKNRVLCFIKRLSAVVLIATLIFAIALSGFIYFAKQPLDLKNLSSAVPLSQAGVRELKDFQPKSIKTGDHLRVVSYNIGYASEVKNNQALALSRDEVDANLAQIASALDRLNADVVALQEVDFYANRSFNIDQLAYLQSALRMPYASFAITWNNRYVAWPYWPIATHFKHIVSGEAVLSRFPILSHELMIFEKPKANPFWYNWFYLDRIVERITLDIGNGRKAMVWNAHLEAFQKETRLDQAKRLGDDVSQYAGDSQLAFRLVLGDMNSPSHIKKELSREEAEELEDHGEALNLVLARTKFENAELPFGPDALVLSMPSQSPIKKIDHILFDKNTLRFVDGSVETDILASDHLPVWADFRLK